MTADPLAEALNAAGCCASCWQLLRPNEAKCWHCGHTNTATKEADRAAH